MGVEMTVYKGGQEELALSPGFRRESAAPSALPKVPQMAFCG